jgi:hypothetical protein
MADLSKDDILEILGDRAVVATAMLCDAVRLDFGHFLAMNVEGRLRSRPNFLARLGRAELVELRERLHRELNVLIERSERPVHALRAQLVAEPVPRHHETELLAQALGQLVAERTLGILVDHRVPGDDMPDLPENPIGAIHAEYKLSYQPSPVLLWAWRQVRAFDQATEVFVNSPDGRTLPTFEIRYYLPEALHVEKAR